VRGHKGTVISTSLRRLVPLQEGARAVDGAAAGGNRPVGRSLEVELGPT
jgi:hypothetical protein